MKQKAVRIEEALCDRRGHLSDTGALIVNTGSFTGRATGERFIVRRAETQAQVHWGPSNQPIDQTTSDRIFNELQKKMASQKTYTFSGNIGGHALVVHSTSAWHIAFSENMFRNGPIPQFLKGMDSYGEIQIFHDPNSTAQEFRAPSPSEALVMIDPIALKIAIVGTAYAGEVKKSAFSICNFSLPDFDILPMHASANCLKDGSNTCVLFGLSGTGKTTLSASADRFLVGDDELLWTKHGISNLEAGCYAKLIDLTELREPEIFRAINRFGSIVENVEFNPNTRELNFASRAITENTRGSYSLSAFEKVYSQDREAELPKTVVFLTADAFGALPAVARLNCWQAQFHFISGYTAKVAGTELGVKEPKAVFSTCFGEPFMPREPSLYANLLNEFCARSETSIWLLNTGWTHGGYGKGDRFPLQISRKILTKIQAGELNHQPMIQHPIFGFHVPTACPGIDSSWLEIPEGPQVESVARAFIKNMERFAGTIDPLVIEQGGPNLSHIEQDKTTSAA
jgi:phosphoenolpyruvate carboxykinase (ATP)